MENTYEDGNNYMCADCAHEWPINQIEDENGEADGIVRDANGNPLADGDAVILIKDLKVKGSSTVLKKERKLKAYDLAPHQMAMKSIVKWMQVISC